MIAYSIDMQVTAMRIVFWYTNYKIYEGTIIELRNIIFFEELFLQKHEKDVSPNKRTYEAANGKH